MSNATLDGSASRRRFHLRGPGVAAARAAAGNPAARARSFLFVPEIALQTRVIQGSPRSHGVHGGIRENFICDVRTLRKHEARGFGR